MRALVVLAALALAAGACKKDEEADTVWVQFNSTADVFPVRVLPEGRPEGEPFSDNLTSSTGRRNVGVVTIDPGAAPVGTVHRIEVEVFEEFEARVRRVELVADTADRGGWTLELTQDSADRGLWVTELRSFGVVDAPREDSFAFILWERVRLPPPIDDN